MVESEKKTRIGSEFAKKVEGNLVIQMYCSNVNFLERERED